MGGAGWQQGAAATSRANLRGGGEADSLRGKPHPTVEGRGGTGSWGFGKCVGRAIPSPAALHPVTQTTFRTAPAEVGSPHSTSLPGPGSSQMGVEGLAPRMSTSSLSFLLPSLPPAPPPQAAPPSRLLPWQLLPEPREATSEILSYLPSLPTPFPRQPPRHAHASCCPSIACFLIDDG